MGAPPGPRVVKDRAAAAADLGEPGISPSPQCPFAEIWAMCLFQM